MKQQHCGWVTCKKKLHNGTRQFTCFSRQHEKKTSNGKSVVAECCGDVGCEVAKSPLSSGSSGSTVLPLQLVEAVSSAEELVATGKGCDSVRGGGVGCVSAKCSRQRQQ